MKWYKRAWQETAKIKDDPECPKGFVSISRLVFMMAATFAVVIMVLTGWSENINDEMD